MKVQRYSPSWWEQFVRLGSLRCVRPTTDLLLSILHLKLSGKSSGVLKSAGFSKAASSNLVIVVVMPSHPEFVY